MLVINTCNHDVDTDEGRVLVPGERAEIADTERHRQLIADGLLTDPADHPEYHSVLVRWPDGENWPAPDDTSDAPAAPATHRPRRQRGAATEEN